MDSQLSKKIKTARIKAGLSQKELAAKLGISTRSISNYESGATSPESNVLIKLTSILDLDLQERLSVTLNNDYDRLMAEAREFLSKNSPYTSIQKQRFILEMVRSYLDAL